MSDVIKATAGVVRSRRQTKVVHYYIVAHARRAEMAGLPTPYICGRVARRSTNPSTERRVPVVGELMVVSETRDCRQCIRAYEAYLRMREAYLRMRDRFT